MQLTLTINGVDFTPYIKEGGVTQSRVSRAARSVVTMDGTEHRTEIFKRKISVALVTVRDGTLARLSDALVSPATVELTDPSGELIVRRCYVSGPSVTAKTVTGGNTYYSGVSFELTEQ